jgi:uncharacterized membrane protein
MKNLLVMAAGTALLFTNNVSLAQSGHMMNGGSWGDHWMGGYGGAWMLILLIVVLVALVVWVVTKNKK